MGTLRFGLSLVVVIFHTGFPAGGPFAVYGFYVLSGYVITANITEKYHSQTLLFYFNRILRLIPAYVISVLLMFASAEIVVRIFHVIGVKIAIPGNDLLKDSSLVRAFLSGALPNWHLTLDRYPVVVGFFKWNPVYWTVVIELIFYLIAPFRIKFIAKKPLMRSGIILVLTFLILVYYSLGITDYSELNRRVYGNFFPSTVYFAMGIFCYYLRREKKYSLSWRQSTFVGAVLLSYLLFGVHRITFSANPIQNWLASALVTGLLTAMTLFSRRVPDVKIARLSSYLGKLAYLVYVIHPFMIELPMFIRLSYRSSRGHAIGAISGFAYGNLWISELVVVASTVACALLLEKVVDAPINRIKRKINVRFL